MSDRAAVEVDSERFDAMAQLWNDRLRHGPASVVLDGTGSRPDEPPDALVVVDGVAWGRFHGDRGEALARLLALAVELVRGEDDLGRLG